MDRFEAMLFDLINEAYLEPGEVAKNIKVLSNRYSFRYDFSREMLEAMYDFVNSYRGDYGDLDGVLETEIQIGLAIQRGEENQKLVNKVIAKLRRLTKDTDISSLNLNELNSCIVDLESLEISNIDLD